MYRVIVISITADSFLQRMVRNIVGVLKQVGVGKLKPSDVERILLSKTRAEVNTHTAPAHALYLMDVRYGAHHDVRIDSGSGGDVM
jgi:tRNA pseudouridine38-40 synthase